ncbi:hypothetical protein AALO_G00075450 [Alosa alosa]|uniref:Uncharacterized protein n=1 Tax=Alosa alosa TaxID=278164 RepID=A0AAV6GWC5_9TELE|nr:hypothetical protein AALO_G00075450 [Alosa alosa]
MEANGSGVTGTLYRAGVPSTKKSGWECVCSVSGHIGQYVTWQTRAHSRAEHLEENRNEIQRGYRPQRKRPPSAFTPHYSRQRQVSCPTNTPLVACTLMWLTGLNGQ